MRPLAVGLLLIASALLLRGSVMQPRSVRNNNPGNIRHGEQWEGRADVQPDPEFVTFVAPEWGFRAMSRILDSYARRGVVTVREIMHTWSPPIGSRPDGSAYTQPTDSAVANVSAWVGVDPDQPLSAAHRVPLLLAIARQEGATWHQADALRGVELAA